MAKFLFECLHCLMFAPIVFILWLAIRFVFHNRE